MLERITAKQGPQPRFKYTPCVKSGPLGVVSGMVALDPVSGQLIDGGVATQTQRIFDNLHLALPEYGFAMDELMLARIYTTAMEQFGCINEVWEKQFAHMAPPARTSVGVTALPLGALVEIEFTFCKS